MHGICVIGVVPGVYQNGSFLVSSINKSAVKVFNVLFDTGALHRSYISKELVDAHRGQWKNALRKFVCMVRLADQGTKKNTSEVITGPIGFIDDEGREFRAVEEAIVWEMSKMDFILGSPDVLRNFFSVFAAILRDAEKIPNNVDVTLAQTEVENLLSFH